MSSTLSPRQVESVEQWLDDQPRSQKENDSIILPGRSQYTKENKEPPRAHFTPTNDRNFPRDVNDRDLHVHSRLQMHSRLSRLSRPSQLGSDHDNYVDPVECFLRVCSACLASAALAVGAVTYVLIHRNRLPSGGSVLDNRLSWVIAVPVSAVAVVWQLTRLSLLAWTSTASSFVLLSVDIVLEALLAVGSVICAILAGFQAARHTTYNSKHHDGVAYQDVGPEISLAALLGLLSITSFGILALSFVEANRRRRSRSSNRSTSSSVIEIIS
ncbi:hypothetical protein SEUCBS140593_007986 [Sporothrix eucalyptigena]|uniref:MARVEL domain-containing protein n=1 Tax=Sporothrix eucalyptigena TaxID=1812306 RepID=A0ABP0CK91_9PEZI